MTAGFRARADADGGDIELGGNGRRELGRDALEDDGEAPRVLEPEGLVEDFLGFGRRLSQRSKPAKDAHALGREPSVPHHGNARIHNAFSVDQSIELDRIGSPRYWHEDAR